MIGIFQGDSYARDYSSAAVATFDGTWTGKWALVLNGVAALSGDMAKSADETKMEIRIHPSQTENLTPAIYTLVAQISNDLLDFKQETQELMLVQDSPL